MSSPKRSAISHKEFNDYVYKIMETATTEQKKLLSETELKQFQSTSTMHNFCTNQNMDRQLAVLTKLGIEWTIMFAPSDEARDKAVFASYEQYLSDEHHLNAIEGMSRNNVFFFGSREIMTQVMMCAQNSQTKAYQFTGMTASMVKFTKIRKEAAKLSPSITMEKGIDAMRDYARISLEALNSTDYVTATIGVSMLQIRVLLALFERVHHSMTANEVVKALRAEDTPKVIHKALDHLSDMKLVTSDKKKPDKAITGSCVYYIISSHGERKICEYIQFIFKNTQS